MTMVEGPEPLVIFRDLPESGDEPVQDRDGLAPSQDYFRAREAAERAAAKRASSALARGLHQELAQHYARRAGRNAA